METLLILATAILPSVLLLAYIYKTDPYPEPTKLLVKSFIYGIATVFPAIIVEGGIQAILFGGEDASHSLIEAATNAFLVAALPEEGLKLLALWLLLRKNPFFDEHIDGIVYAIYVSLGFATIENITYLFGNIDDWMSVGVTRALLAVPGHFAFGVLMGFFYSLYYFVERSRRNKMMIFVAPFLAHGIYDTFAMSASISPTFGIIGFIGLVGFCIWMHRFCRNRIGSHLHRDKKLFGNYA
jgi:RsiW-degrading membrane proteinase PrsW (M82 family)